MEPAIEQFVDQLIVDKKFGSLEPEILAEIKADLYNETKESLESALVESLSEPELEEYTKLLEAEDAPKAANFLREKLPALDQIIAKRLIQIRGVYLAT